MYSLKNSNLRKFLTNKQNAACSNFTTEQIDQLFRELYSPLYFYSLQITGFSAVAEDLTSEAFLRLINTETEIRNIKSFLFRIVRNLSLDWIKVERNRKLRIQNLTQSTEETDADLFGALVKAEMLRHLDTGIGRMPVQRRKVMQLLFKEGRSAREVAEELNLAISTVNEHKKEGIIFLRKISNRFNY